MWFGCRPGELVALAKSRPNVDYKRGEIVFETEKTKVERKLYFDGFTAEYLKRFLDAEPSYGYVYKICKRVGIKPKAGRQSFITHMQRRLVKADFDPVLISPLVKIASGHTLSGDIQATYTSYVEDLQKMFAQFHYMKPLEERFQEKTP